MKRTWKMALSLMLMMLLVISLVAGCSSKPATTESATTVKTAQAAEAATAAPEAETTEEAEPIEPVVLKISLAESSTDVKAEVFADFIKEVEEATNGEIKFEVYYSNELGTLAEVTEQKVMGANILSGGSGDFYAVYGSPDITAIALNYVLTNQEAIEKVNDSDLFKSWCDMIEAESGLKILCCNFAGAPRSVLSTKPINSVEDLKGLKIRVPGKAMDAFFTELDAATMTMKFSDIYTSMQQGMVEACEAPLNTLYAYSLQEVAKYCYLSEHSLAPGVWSMSASVWNTISPESQEILQSTMVKYGGIMSAKALESQEEFKQKLVDAGVTIVVPSADDKAVLQAAGMASFGSFPELTPGLADEIAAIIN